VLNSPSLRPGAIILLHAGGPNTPAALDELITSLRQRGYAIVPLSVMV
jgi:peptidoglycan/xylan/chitin deacetylase (PgdA/CDA1 family)